VSMCIAACSTIQARVQETLSMNLSDERFLLRVFVFIGWAKGRKVYKKSYGMSLSPFPFLVGLT
jgi:hypothetical protein